MKKILLVEDEDINIDVISSYIGGEYKLDVARNGPDAIELLTKNTYDLFLMELILEKV